MGLAHSVHRLGHPADLLDLYPAQAQRDADIPADEGRGQRFARAADRKLLPLSEQQVRAAGAARRHRRSGRGLVHRAVLRSVLPHHHAETRLHPGLRADRPVADHRHAVLHLLRLAVRPHRAAEDHPGRLPDRGRDLLPAVRRAHPLRQSRPRGVRAEEPDHADGRRLDLQGAHLRHRVHQVLRPATGPRTSSPSSASRSRRRMRRAPPTRSTWRSARPR